MIKSCFIILFTVSLFLTQLKGQTSEPCIIKGKLTGKNIPSELILSKVSNGEPESYIKITVSEDGSFKSSFTPEYNGFYLLNNNRIYITSGKQIEISIADNSYTILNPEDKENLTLASWNQVILRLRGYGIAIGKVDNQISYKDIFQLLPEIVKQKADFTDGINTGNVSFDSLFKRMAQSEFENQLYSLLLWTPKIRPTVEEYPKLYSELSSEKHFTSSEVLDYDFGLQFISTYLQYKKAIRLKEGTINAGNLLTNLCIENIQNDTVKGWYFLKQLRQSIAYDQSFIDKTELAKKYFALESQKNQFSNIIQSLKSLAIGEPAINIDGTTLDGKKVSLSDFRGKVVLVDVWATWCAPCKAEIPFLQKMEEELDGKDIVFVSFSTFDKHDTWKKFVVDQKLGGIQLSSSPESELIIKNQYKISGIPRFMVFDKEGKIVTVNAPRPSDPLLKELLLTELKK